MIDFQRIHEEHGASTMESIALLCVVVLIISIILNVFHSNYINEQGVLVESGSARIQRALDDSLDSQIDRYRRKRTHGPDLWQQLQGFVGIQAQDALATREE